MIIKPSVPGDLTTTANLMTSTEAHLLAELNSRMPSTTHHSSAAASTQVAEPTPPSMPTVASLSPDALMAYCESRLNSLDSQMNGIFSSQQKNAQLTTDVNGVAGAFGDLPGPNSSNPPMINVSPTDQSAIEAQYTQAIAAAGGPNTQLGASLSKDAATFANEVSGGQISSDDVSQLTANLKNDASDLNSDSEMTMINLQSLMSQRQTAVQLTTNLVQSLGDQQNDIAKNVGQ